MNYVPLGIKTDYSLLNSLIKIDTLIDYAKEHKFNTIGILDDNLYGIIEFYLKCQKNKIKPIIGLEIKYNSYPIYLYAKNYQGLQNLFVLGRIKEERDLTISDLDLYSLNIFFVLPFSSYNIYQELGKKEIYLAYQCKEEKVNALVITENIVYLSIVKMLNKNENELLNYLEMINFGKNISNYPLQNYTDLNLKENKCITEEDRKSTINFSEQINIVIPQNKRYLPKYKIEEDSYQFLQKLSVKGLKKRLNNNISKEYQERLIKELTVIKEMGFVDYFLIVYDYVLYAHKNNILVNTRGSAAGSLVSYSLGITNIDPIKYDLLFERFLNKERITMPDIDVDFEDVRRDEIKKYLEEKYGKENVASIITFSTLKSKQVLRDVIKIFDIEDNIANKLLKEINAQLDLKTNYDKNNKLKSLIEENEMLKKVYRISINLEGLKKQTSTHAAGVVLSSLPLIEIVPLTSSGDNNLVGVTMEYLESIGLLKMDLLALNNLTIIHNCLDLIEDKLDLANIPLDDPKTYELFANGDTDGIFQFESEGMKNFLKKLKPNVFSDLYSAVALYRPGPMDNIDLFIKRKHGLAKIDYIHPDLESILKYTYGIIIYQEQIIQILTKMAGYSLSESDLVRKSMSKKDYNLLAQEKNKFIEGCLKNNYSKNLAENVFELILKFASYGFNKAHSVSYALVSYQLAYLKANYPVEFITNLLNSSIGSVNKTKEYLNMAKRMKIKIIDFNLKTSKDKYQIIDNKISLPLTLIKGISANQVQILNELFDEEDDIFGFTIKSLNKEIPKEIVEKLIKVGVFDKTDYNRQTLLTNLDNIYDYAYLVKDLDSSLVAKPILETAVEMNTKQLLENEIELVGFYISNHPTVNYYTKNMVKIIDVEKYFDKNIEIVVLIERIKEIKTKRNEDMAFITAGDETGSSEFILFPRNINLLSEIKENKVIIVNGKVTKKNDKYGIIINKIKCIGENK